MVKYGIVTKYNGKYGYIVTEEGKIIDFCREDISFDKDIKVNDVVIFRIEEKNEELSIARNIKVYKKTL